jgi:hypothetical protein
VIDRSARRAHQNLSRQLAEKVQHAPDSRKVGPDKEVRLGRCAASNACEVCVDEVNVVMHDPRSVLRVVRDQFYLHVIGADDVRELAIIAGSRRAYANAGNAITATIQAARTLSS